ncbi:fragmin60 [Punctularia strigosozonata HHB-11173 SS5]|uniref:fragmin60 n=1 Tax=Punctularia strigosozonata (strain HHB-11173) TaxID=741275 RepID=UPI0004416D5F|nr:fragmin60 [Punctularia strigosozonata HHB-11173 SS5]EIN13016.1 fragmin60 [Punctularia strigosozonata HHB-11173 SS5]
MAHLTKPTQYNIEDSNIALLGSDLEKRVREHSGDAEPAWQSAGLAPGLQIWRIENFSVATWPKDRYGVFYDGDSYIILNTYKKQPDSEELSYDLHFWLGRETSQDEAGTAAYKTVELDDHLHGVPVQYREVQGHESAHFLAHFPRFICLHGGVATGFHHVTEAPPEESHRLYEIHLSGSHLVVREVAAEASSLHQGDVYVLDKGDKIWQLNTQNSLGKEKFKAAEFVRSLADARKDACDVTVYEEGGHGAGIFFAEFGIEGRLHKKPNEGVSDASPRLFRISDASGQATFEDVEPVSRSSLSSVDVFLLDNSADPANPGLYVWIGSGSTLNERRLVLEYAQRYLHQRRENQGSGSVAVSIVKMVQGREPASFFRALCAS